MISFNTTVSDTSKLRLPCDAMHPLFALSMRRKLRYLYDGNYFSYQNSNGDILDYPNSSEGLNGSTLIKIYDQKLKFGYPKFDAIQNDPSKRPIVLVDEDGPYVSFSLGQFLEIDGSAEYFNSPNFTITIIGDGDVPRPMLGIYGEVDMVTVEPGSPTNRFTFNDNFGSVSENSNNRINQLFSGVDPSQNGKRVITMKSDGGGRGQNLSSNTSTNFTRCTLGKAKDRYFSGTFIEATLHLGDLTKTGANQIWEEAKEVY